MATETTNTSTIDWTKFPTFQDFAGQRLDSQGGAVRDYVDYERTLDAWASGPNPQDFATKQAFADAQRQYIRTRATLESVRGLQTIGGRVIKGIPVNPDDKAKVILAEKIKSGREEIKRELARTDVSLAKYNAYKKDLPALEAQESAVATEAKKTASVLAAANDPKARATKLSGFNIPVPGVVSRGSTAPGGKRVTLEEWSQLWADKSVVEQEQFKNLLIKAGYKDADITSLEQIGTVWNNLGVYLGRQGKKGKFYDKIDATAVKDFGTYVESSGTGSGGAAGPSAAEIAQAKAVAATTMRQFYLDNGLPFTEQSIDRLATGVAKGTSSLEAEAERLRKTILAKQYPEWSEQINAGYSIRQLAEPYIDAMAGALELNSTDIKVTDPLIQAALQTKDEKGTYTTATLRDFEIALRKDDRWQNTKAGSDWIASVNTDLLQTFGLEK